MIKRYKNTQKIQAGRALGTPQAAKVLAKAAREGRIRLRTRVLKEDERLDVVAGEEFGDARMWWIIAACSGIGWAIQVPGGTELKIPAVLAEVKALVG
jgi:hypothetical protein